MKFLNLGCGYPRPQGAPWINIDNLHAVFPNPGCPERVNMDAEPNFLNHDIREPLPFPDGSVDGILMSHVLEHFDLQGGMVLLRECKRVLPPSGVLRVSVPCPERFHQLTIDGCKDWGERNPHSDMTFMQWALFFFEHKQLISASALQCMFNAVGFEKYEEKEYRQSWKEGLAALDNRPKFSLFMEAMK